MDRNKSSRGSTDLNKKEQRRNKRILGNKTDGKIWRVEDHDPHETSFQINIHHLIPLLSVPLKGLTRQKNKNKMLKDQIGLETSWCLQIHAVTIHVKNLILSFASLFELYNSQNN